MAFHTDKIGNAKHFFIFEGRNIVVRGTDSVGREDFFALLENGKAKNAFFEDDYDYSAAILADGENLSAGLEKINLREYFSENPDKSAILLSSRAKAISAFRSSTRFCPTCASPLSDSPNLSALFCPKCRREIFPRIEPATITLVTRGNEILLARHATRIQNLWACLSGFVEAGETAEHCVEREIMEEVGIKVKNIKYRASQSWPFPNQLMLAFTAEYESGEIKAKADEIAEAKWFSRDDLPAIPPAGSVAYNLIMNFSR